MDLEWIGIKRYTKGTQTGLNGPDMDRNEKVHKRYTDRSKRT